MDPQKELTRNDRHRRSKAEFGEHTRSLAPENIKKGKVSRLPGSKVETKINNGESNVKERRSKGSKLS